ncbi:hypothetical protein ACDH60_10285 [Pseudomonas ficuserectae]|nr:hypothetical protein [Pseudomonas amygdali]ARA79614.1 hypothetical protein B5U27_05775 [Pseudomonas amygdali pv. lachrymans]AXH54879.1 hypothetical protein PLA107_005680 [Pseudomonas amygdali pv. lachrymans str. M301315]KPC01802.1 Uncharacterized protein AC501_3085 [Pseudomonas amygdali pv. lachrymans]PWC99057.1 hypothetical protein CX658_28755 [Pseudomonas amygdali pv. lachrymans]QWA49159.1 hypothetical protein C4C37_21605 [Pseudomonas amygdali pv. lachrymans]
MQSHDYVPNVSGWKLSKDGSLEINSARFSVGGLPEQPQMITVAAGEWAARDLPENAWEYYAFIGSQITKIPAEYRASAKISTSDESYEPGFADIRVMLTYERRETAEELSARMKKSKGAGYSIKKEGDKFTFSHDGLPRIVLGNLDKADEKIETPFAVEGDQVSLAQAFIDAGKLSPVWGVRTTTNAAGQTVLAGVGAGLGCMCEGGYTGTPGDKEEKPSVKIDFKVDVSKGLDQLRAALSETELGKALAAKIEHEFTIRASADTQLAARIGAVEARVNQGLGVADQVREVLRSELRPGGLLWRGR